MILFLNSVCLFVFHSMFSAFCCGCDVSGDQQRRRGAAASGADRGTRESQRRLGEEEQASWRGEHGAGGGEAAEGPAHPHQGGGNQSAAQPGSHL